ncbi:MAG TPA: SpoIIE family protein phosphatase [Stellaceae bacterium]|nr:SpoIIE family protein phosphatase [Stellaceae bacterium]
MNDTAAATVRPEDIAELLRQQPIFAQFDAASLAAVARRCGVASFAAGEALMRQGEAGDFACLILEGEVDVYIEIPAGRVHLATVGRHRIVGELGAFADMPRTATVLARTPVVAIAIERASLMRLAAEHPQVAFTIIAELGGRLSRMNRPLAYLSYAAEALARDEYDEAMLAELTKETGQLANFARAFAHMAREIRQKEQRREEMQAAAEIQKSILPRPFEREGALAAIDLHAEMHPARDIGGDFYDYFALPDGRLALTIADVSGKGIPAALFMAISRTVLRGVAGRGDMAARMAEANRLLAADNEASMFVTMVHAVLDPVSGRLRYCNAGHNPPYLLRGEGENEALPATGCPFGISTGLPHGIGETVMRPGDALFLYTDGITEAFDTQGEEYGAARLESALEAARGLGASGLVAHVLAGVARFAAGAEQSDDITALALRYRP